MLCPVTGGSGFIKGRSCHYLHIHNLCVCSGYCHQLHIVSVFKSSSSSSSGTLFLREAVFASLNSKISQACCSMTPGLVPSILLHMFHFHGSVGKTSVCSIIPICHPLMFMMYVQVLIQRISGSNSCCRNFPGCHFCSDGLCCCFSNKCHRHLLCTGMLFVGWQATFHNLHASA